MDKKYQEDTIKSFNEYLELHKLEIFYNPILYHQVQRQMLALKLGLDDWIYGDYALFRWRM